MSKTEYLNYLAQFSLFSIIIGTLQVIATAQIDSQYKNRCGFLSLHYWTDIGPNGRIIDIYEDSKRQEESKLEFNAINSDLIEDGHLTVTNQTCQAEICGYTNRSLFDYGPADDFHLDLFEDDHCTLFSVGETTLPELPFMGLYTIKSIGCKCQTNRPECANPTCGKMSSNTSILNVSRYCASLFFESDCQECETLGIQLEHGRFYNTTGNKEIRSIFVPITCKIRFQKRNGFGNSWEFGNSISDIPVEHYQKLEGFSCYCDPKSSEPTNQTAAPGSKKLSVSEIVLINGSVAVVFVLSMVAIVYFKMIRGRKSTAKWNLQLTDEDIQDLFNGAQIITDVSDAAENSFEFHESYLSILSLPYNSEVEIDRKKLLFDEADPEKIIGHGCFGTVHKAELRFDNEKHLREVAVKSVKIPSTKEDLKSLINEIKILSFIGKHPNIVDFLGACTINLKAGELLSVMELCSFGDLKKYLLSKRESTFSLNLIQDENGYSRQGDINIGRIDLLIQLSQFAKDIAAGMEYLGQMNVLHIDLCARNILLSKDKRCKIGDFGLSRKWYEKPEYHKNCDGFAPVKWIALECITERKYSIKSDVWAYAVTIWEIFSLGLDPYAGKSFQEIFCFLQSGERLYCPLLASQEIYEIMKSCWHSQPECRLSFAELKDFFENVEIKVVNLEVKND